MGKAARLRGKRQRSEAEARVRAEADREKLEEAFGERLLDLEAAIGSLGDLGLKDGHKIIAHGTLYRIEVAEGPRLKLTIWVDP